jgi:SAM-dependent methyltransferase
MRCLVCSESHWKSLPVPVSGRSISTSGIIFDEQLEREQCMSCGLLQRRNRNFIGQSRFYEDRYQGYFERPASELFDHGRYVAMANWMASCLPSGFAPQSILDVGCGAGWSMRPTRELYPGAALTGVEPSAANAQKSRSAGFDVIEARLEEVRRDQTYDLIYSNNVLQHVTDPNAFLADLAGFMSPQGCLALLLPDASEPSHEMMWCDHNFSFCPRDLAGMAAQAGLRVQTWKSNPPVNSLLNKQMVVLVRADGTDHHFPVPSISAEELFDQRSAYMVKWQALDGELMRRITGHRRVFNFGASMWSWLLAGYCPDYWRTVHACLVDGGSGQCVGKSVGSPSDFEFAKGDCIVLGVNPVSQAGLRERLSGLASEIITWADGIRR